MKKALIITNLSGFLLKFEVENVRLLQQLGYEVHYASNINEKGYIYEPEQYDELGVIFHHIDIARSPYMFQMNARALKQLICIVENEKIDIIHCHTPVGAVLGRLAGTLCRNIPNKPKVIYTAHGFHFYKGAPLVNNIVYQSVERIMAHLTDTLVVINEEDYQSAQAFHLRNKGTVYQIPGIGIDFSVFHPVSKTEKRKLRRELGIPEEAFYILSVGELNQNKNHRTVLLAIKKMKDRNLLGDEVFYGICGDGFFRENIKAYTRDLDIEDRVKFFGYQRNIRDYYAIADITIFPSKREGLGMAGIESLAMGVPVIAADNRGTREYMQDGKNGYVCQYDDVDGYIEKIKLLKDLSKDEMESMKKFCVKSAARFDKQYTQQIMANAYGELDIEVNKWKNQ